MNETLALERLTEKCGSIYEAVIIIARRARQINEQQHRLIEKEVALNAPANNDDMDDEDVSLEHDYVDSQYLKLPKPTTIALQEMLDGKLTFEYIKNDE
jgi:DNA-directed RNA polymerase omega subunit